MLILDRTKPKNERNNDNDNKKIDEVTADKINKRIDELDSIVSALTFGGDI